MTTPDVGKAGRSFGEPEHLSPTSKLQSTMLYLPLDELIKTGQNKDRLLPGFSHG